MSLRSVAYQAFDKLQTAGKPFDAEWNRIETVQRKRQPYAEEDRPSVAPVRQT